MKTAALLLKVMVFALAICILPGGARADYYAAQNGQAPSGAYTTWESAASNIQDAINAAPTNGTVWVGAGSYTLPTNAVVSFNTTNVVYINKPLTLRSSNSVPASTRIDGGGLYRGIAVDYTATTTNRFVIDGFTISNCFALNTGTNGGAAIIFNSVAYGGNYTGVVQNCLISDNTVTSALSASRNDGGGGIYIRYTAHTFVYYIISNCTFRNNRVLHNKSTGGGGGVYLLTEVGGVIDNCLFESNSVVNGVGGGLAFFNPGVHNIRNSVIRDNLQIYIDFAGSASFGGGAMSFMYSAAATMQNCLIYNNYADGMGGGIFAMGGFGTSIAMYNCAVVSNKTIGGGSGGIYCRPGWSDGLQLYNSIVYSNFSSFVLADIGIISTSVNVFANNCVGTTNIGGGVSILNVGSGNITNNPAFVNWTEKNFRLTHNSPCVNRGFNQDWMTNAVDLDGRTRLRYGRVDMGAYEVIYDGTIYKFH